MTSVAPLDRFVRWVATRIGVPVNESPLFCRDVILALLFVPAGIGIALSVFEQQFGVAFWLCSLLAVGSLYFATKRQVLLASLIGFFAIRFAFGALIFRSLRLLLASALCAGVAIAIAYWDRTDYPDSRIAGNG